MKLFFLVKGKTFSFGTTLRAIRISELLGAELNQFYCVCYCRARLWILQWFRREKSGL